MNSGRKNFNDMSEVKSSVKNTKGMLSTRYKWLSRPYPYYWVQPTSKTYGYEDYFKRLSCNNSLPGDQVVVVQPVIKLVHILVILVI